MVFRGHVRELMRCEYEAFRSITAAWVYYQRAGTHSKILDLTGIFNSFSSLDPEDQGSSQRSQNFFCIMKCFHARQIFNWCSFLFWSLINRVFPVFVFYSLLLNLSVQGEKNRQVREKRNRQNWSFFQNKTSCRLWWSINQNWILKISVYYFCVALYWSSAQWMETSGLNDLSSPSTFRIIRYSSFFLY